MTCEMDWSGPALFLFPLSFPSYSPGHSLPLSSEDAPSVVGRVQLELLREMVSSQRRCPCHPPLPSGFTVLEMTILLELRVGTSFSDLSALSFQTSHRGGGTTAKDGNSSCTGLPEVICKVLPAPQHRA